MKLTVRLDLYCPHALDDPEPRTVFTRGATLKMCDACYHDKYLRIRQEVNAQVN